MLRLKPMFTVLFMFTLCVVGGCADDTADGSPQVPGFGSGEVNWGGGNGGNNGGTSTPGNNGTPALPSDMPEPERCNLDEDCPADLPYCAVSSYCAECLEDTHCPSGTQCTKGLCLSDSCQPAQTQCSGNILLTCNPKGTKWLTTTCPGANGQCVSGACTGCDPGTSKCTGKHERMVCSNDGSQLTTESCGESLCVDGACMGCYPGVKQCDSTGAWVQTCNASGQWENTENCGAGQGQCAAGVCQSPCGQGGKLSNEGCDYWAVDMDNEGPAANSPYAVIVSNLNAYPVSITVTSRTSLYSDPVTVAQGQVAPGELEAFELPQQNMGKSGLFWKALRIQSSGPIVAYQFNPLDNVGVFSNDASLLLPSNTFGKEYVVVSREEIPASGLETYRGSIAIVATAESTQVTITPSAPTMGGSGVPQLEAGESTTLTLEPYQVLNIQSDMLGADLTGTIITADKPIGVFGGHEAAVGSEQCCADHLEQQLFPVSTWGTDYVATKSKARGIEKDYWRIVAAKDGTTVNINPPVPGVASPIKLNRGAFYEFKTDKDFFVSSNHPILLAQTLASSQEIAGPPTCLTSDDCAPGYSCSFVSPECMLDSPYCDSKADCPESHNCVCGDLGICSCEPIGDPALILAAPVSQFRSSYVFLTPTNYMADYVNIIAPAGTTVEMDGTPISPYAFTKVGDGSYQVARMKVADGVHRIEANKPIGVVAYGFDDDVSYGYPAGLDLSVQQ